MTALKIINARIPTETGIRENVSIFIDNGIIEKISVNRIDKPFDSLINAKDHLVLPGLVDIHTHLRGLDYSYKETFFSGTSSAAAGGVTTVFDMPNSSPPTNSEYNIKNKILAISKEKVVNVGIYAGLPSDLHILNSLIHNPYIFGLKIFLYNKLFLKDFFKNLDYIFKNIKSYIPILIHGELPVTNNNYSNVNEFLQLHNPLRELLSYISLISLISKYDIHIHFCHVSLPSAVSLLNNYNDRITFEVTPHHLYLENSILSNLDGIGKCLPPLRSNLCRKYLHKQLINGEINIIASDHAPHAESEKLCGFKNAANGIPGLETLFPLLFTEVATGKISLNRFINFVSKNPARLMKLNKGEILPKYDGDLIIIDSKKKWNISGESFLSKSKITPFDGYLVQGKILHTIVGGDIVYSGDSICVKPGKSGKILKRTNLL